MKKDPITESLNGRDDRLTLGELVSLREANATSWFLAKNEPKKPRVATM